MTNIRRYYVPNAIVFITSITQNRFPLFSIKRNIGILNLTVENVKQIHPFEIMAYVLLPDHFHWLLRLSEGDDDFSKILKSVKGNFTANYKKANHIIDPVSLWQKRFWDHVIRDEQDLKNHMDYIHWNPVKHGCVDAPEKWIHSSYPQWLEFGIYESGWGINKEPENINKMRFE